MKVNFYSEPIKQGDLVPINYCIACYIDKFMQVHIRTKGLDILREHMDVSKVERIDVGLYKLPVRSKIVDGNLTWVTTVPIDLSAAYKLGVVKGGTNLEMETSPIMEVDIRILALVAGYGKGFCLPPASWNNVLIKEDTAIPNNYNAIRYFGMVNKRRSFKMRYLASDLISLYGADESVSEKLAIRWNNIREKYKLDDSDIYIPHLPLPLLDNAYYDVNSGSLLKVVRKEESDSHLVFHTNRKRDEFSGEMVYDVHSYRTRSTGITHDTLYWLTQANRKANEAWEANETTVLDNVHPLGDLIINKVDAEAGNIFTKAPPELFRDISDAYYLTDIRTGESVLMLNNSIIYLKKHLKVSSDKIYYMLNNALSDQPNIYLGRYILSREEDLPLLKRDSLVAPITDDNRDLLKRMYRTNGTFTLLKYRSRRSSLDVLTTQPNMFSMQQYLIQNGFIGKTKRFDSLFYNNPVKHDDFILAVTVPFRDELWIGGDEFIHKNDLVSKLF